MFDIKVWFGHSLWICDWRREQKQNESEKIKVNAIPNILLLCDVHSLGWEKHSST